MDWETIRKNAKTFQKNWKARDSNERQDVQNFIADFLYVFGINRPTATSSKESVFYTKYRVTRFDGGIGYIDGYVPGKLIIEMKPASVSKDKDLDEAYYQALEYYNCLSLKKDNDGNEEEELPLYILISNFNKFILYDMRSGEKTVEFSLSGFANKVRYFDFLLEKIAKHRPTYDFELNKKAAYSMTKLHRKMKSLGYEGHELNMYLVRLLFCLFADDTGVFGKDVFYDYVRKSKEDGSNLGDRIANLFEVLDKSPEQRQEQIWISEELLSFQYINGGLFKERLSTFHFDAEMRNILLKCCDFNWNRVKPEIFGSLFQETMDAFERHEFGAHYTSEENILKVINPLFLDDLKREFIEAKKSTKTLERFYEKLHTLKFFDPACGCGNFLIVAYRELRLLEMDVLRAMRDHGQTVLDAGFICKVNVDQFYGIEIEEFPAQIAKVGMWLCDHLMNKKAGEIFQGFYPHIPFKESATIVCGNALRVDWNSVVSNTEVNYIFGNPPYLGARVMNKEQKNDMRYVFGKSNGVGNLDYVAAWFKKAARYMAGTQIKTAFVSTNSISQGEQPAILWPYLYEEGTPDINFAYRSFVWKNATKNEAKVHCVIIGFDMLPPNNKVKMIFSRERNDAEGKYFSKRIVKNVNPYLMDADNILINSRTLPLSNVPYIGIGNKPIDGGFYLFKKEEMEQFIEKEPLAAKYFRPWLGSKEFIRKSPRYCLFLRDCSPSEIRKMPECVRRIESVKKYRLASTNQQTVDLATKPLTFHVENIPESTYLLIPSTSGENREYVPIGFVDSNTLSSNAVLIMPEATLYHFGVVTSRMHMTWLRTIGGRLKSDYRYSKEIVYNNFPWPEPTDSQKSIIETAAQKVLDERNKFPDKSFEDLYGEVMPESLRKAHAELDKAVEKAYNRKFKSEVEIYNYLLEKYVEKIEEEKRNNLFLIN